MTVALLAGPAAAGQGVSGTPQERSVPLRQLIDAYMAAYTGRDRSRHIYVRAWADLLGEHPVATLDADTVADAFELLRTTPARRYVGLDRATGQPVHKDLGLRKPATLNRYKSSLSAVFTWGKRQHRRLLPRGWVNPCREIAGLPEKNARTRFLSPDERERLLAVARLSECTRLYLFVLMALTTGARRGELLGLRYADLDLEQATATLHTSKNGRPRVLPLTAAVVAEIRRLGRPVSPAALLFAGRHRTDRPMAFDTAWHTALQQARIENFRVHDLRHSAASYCAQAGASLLEIADLLGHQSLDVTRRYSHLVIDNKRRLVDRVLGGIGGAS
jgi:integrase